MEQEIWKKIPEHSQYELSSKFRYRRKRRDKVHSRIIGDGYQYSHIHSSLQVYIKGKRTMLPLMETYWELFKDDILKEGWRVIPEHPDYLISSNKQIMSLKQRNLTKDGLSVLPTQTINGIVCVCLDGSTYSIDKLFKRIFPNILETPLYTFQEWLEIVKQKFSV